MDFRDAISAMAQQDSKNSTSSTSVRNNTFIDVSKVERDVNADCIEFERRLEDLGINLTCLQPILRDEGNQLILSCAGSGKTTALVLKLIRDMVSGVVMKPLPVGDKAILVPDKIWVSTFLKSGANELSKAFTTWCQKLKVTGVNASDITFSTLHSEFYGALKDVGLTVTIAPDVSKYIRKACTHFAIRNKTIHSNSITEDEISDISSMISYSRNRLDENKYIHPLTDEYGMTELLFESMINYFAELRRKDGVIDFEDLQEYLYVYSLKNPNISAFLGARYNHIYLDEFQDTSQIQYALLQNYIDGVKRVLVIGDDDQTIYSWRGSDNKIITSRVEKDWGLTCYTLDLNYRCGGNILEAVIPSISQNTERHPKSLKTAHKGKGEVKIVEKTALDSLLQSVYEQVALGKTVGILGRTNADLIMPSILLEVKGKSDFRVTKAVNLDNRMAKHVLMPFNIVTKRFTQDFGAFFKSFLPFARKFEVDALCEVLQNNKTLSIFNIDEQDLKECTPFLYRQLLKDLRVAYSISPLEALQCLWKFMFLHYDGKSSYCARIRDFIANMLILVTTCDIFKNTSLTEISRFIQEDVADSLKERKNNTTANITLSTVHEAKGKEWDIVFLWNDTDGTFPAKIGNRDITKEEYEEERRLHYIAWTRAKELLCVCTDFTNPSPFLLECDVQTGVKDALEDEHTTPTLKQQVYFDAKAL